MKTKILSLSAFILSLSVAFTSCQKDSKSDTSDNTEEVTKQSDDGSRFSTESDGVANEINGILETTTGFSGRPGGTQGFICDANVVIDTLSNPRTISITFDGTACVPGRTRTGVIVVSMNQGVRWKDAGAQLNVSFQNFKITRTIDNKSITFNGTQTYTNVTGGLLINLASLGTITHAISSNNLSITFDNNQQRVWQVARQRSFTYNNGVIITVTGTHTEGNITGVAEWGTNRFGHSFTTAITSPLIFRQDCDFRLTSGEVKHATQLFNATVTFGLNANGNPTSCPGASASYFLKSVWTGPLGNTHSVILPY
ncbi:MAG TPA: hypothetical protein PK275_03830 [Chitinophagaceae bacterium]|nr:hypothetical protein [Chitinophagaceae bacterium]